MTAVMAYDSGMRVAVQVNPAPDAPAELTLSIGTHDDIELTRNDAETVIRALKAGLGRLEALRAAPADPRD